MKEKIFQNKKYYKGNVYIFHQGWWIASLAQKVTLWGNIGTDWEREIPYEKPFLLGKE